MAWSCFTSHRQGCRQGCSLPIRFDFKPAAQLPNALAHSGDAHPDDLTGFFARSKALLRHAVPLVANFQNRRRAIGRQTHKSRITPGVPVNISQTLLHNAEQGRLVSLRQPGVLSRQVERYFDATSARKAVYIPLDSGSEATFVEERRM